MYLPYNDPDSFGTDYHTGYALGGWTEPESSGVWNHVRQVFDMNTVTVEGTGDADGLYEMWVDDAMRFQKTDEVFRFYEGAMATHLQFSLFYGGSDSWSGGGGVIDIANLRVVETTGAASEPCTPFEEPRPGVGIRIGGSNVNDMAVPAGSGAPVVFKRVAASVSES